MTTLPGEVGFASPATEQKFSKRRAGIELLATGALAVGLIVAVTAVSIGMAHAQAFETVQSSDGSSLALAIFLGSVFASMGGLTAIAARDRRPRRR